MGLETGTYITDLVTTNPVNSDVESQGAAHLRLIKTVLKNTFPNAARAFPITVASTKTANYVIQATDAEAILCIDTTAGNVTLTLPTLGSGDAGWSIETIKINGGLNPYFIVPASGTLQSGELGTSLSKTRRCVIGRKVKTIWTGSLWFVDRAVGFPIGSLLPYGSTILPVGYEWPNGQTLSSAVNYPDYFAIVNGAGGTPDLRGRAPFGVDNMGGSAAGRITVAGGNYDGTSFGTAGGAQNHTLSTAELPVHSHTITDPGHTHTVQGAANLSASGIAAGAAVWNAASPTTTSNNTTGITATNNAGSGAAHSIMPPSMVLNYLLVVE